MNCQSCNIEPGQVRLYIDNNSYSVCEYCRKMLLVELADARLGAEEVIAFLNRESHYADMGPYEYLSCKKRCRLCLREICHLACPNRNGNSLKAYIEGRNRGRSMKPATSESETYMLGFSLGQREASNFLQDLAEAAC